MTVTDPIRGTSEPGRYWSSTNLGEAVPDVMTPMCWSVWRDPAELGWLYSMYALGVISKDGVRVSPDTNDHGLAVFYGRQALNLDAIRKTLSNLPGVDADDFERDLAGTVRENAPQFPSNPRRVPVLAVKAPRTLLRHRRRILRQYDAVREWWVNEVLDVGANRAEPVGRPIDRLVRGRQEFGEMFKIHCVTRFVFQGVQSVIFEAAGKVGDESLAARLMSGVGGVNETRMTDDLWRIGRGELDVETFVRNWGYHGPNEGNLFTRSWREDPTPVEVMARSYARRADAERPLRREERAMAGAAEAEAQLLEAVSRLQRPVMRWLLQRTRSIVRTLHVGKAGYLMALDGARAGARAFGAEQVDKGVFNEVDDVFFFTVEECEQIDRNALPEVAEIIRQRRETRAEYLRMKLPITFYGMPEAVMLEDGHEGQQQAERDRAAGVAVEFSGAASGGGTVEGRARVVLDPNEDVELDDGDILVCRFTDPSWAPLMSLAEGLVIDMGGAASHGAVVARELDIPFVIGAEVATSALRDGDRILLDGAANRVALLARGGDVETAEVGAG